MYFINYTQIRKSCCRSFELFSVITILNKQNGNKAVITVFLLIIRNFNKIIYTSANIILAIRNNNYNYLFFYCKLTVK